MPDTSDDNSTKGLRRAFRAALAPRADQSAFFTSGLVAVDANVLLRLYSMTTAARADLLNALSAVAPRMWIPHHVGLEFIRHRSGVLVDRAQAVSRLDRALQQTEVELKDRLSSAVTALIEFREVSATTVQWDPVTHRLDAESIRKTAYNLLEPLRAEVKRLKGEHDLKLEDVTEPSKDPVLTEIEKILGDNIGERYPFDRMRELVRTAVEFRYPNKIPPGYKDADKATDIGAAGDYILWRQLIDYVHDSPPSSSHVLLVTADAKEDWWELDTHGRPVRPRVELVQEFEEETGCELLLLSIREFLQGASVHLGRAVSNETLAEVQAAEDAVSAEAESAQEEDPDSEGARLSDLPVGLAGRYRRVIEAFRLAGYDVTLFPAGRNASPIVLEVRESSGDGAVVALYLGGGVRDSIRQLRVAKIISGIPLGILVGTAIFKPAARRLLTEGAIKYIHVNALDRFLDDGMPLAELARSVQAAANEARAAGR